MASATTIKFKPRKTSTEVRADAPEGEWGALIPKGRCKVLVTQRGEPRLVIPFKLEKAEDERNEAFHGSEVVLSVIIFDDDDPEKRRGANLMKGRLRALCEACDLDFGEVYPAGIVETDEDFDPLFRAIDGKRVTVWTRHVKRTAESGEEITDTEVVFRKPASGLVTVDGDQGKDNRASKKRKGARRRR